MRRTFGACALAAATGLALAPTTGFGQILTSGGKVNSVPAPAPAQAAKPTVITTGGPRPERATADATGAPSNPGKALRCLLGGGIGGIVDGVRAGLGSGANVGDAITAGAQAGCRLFANWSPRDRNAFEDASQDAFDDPTGRPRGWVAPDSRDQVTLVATDAGNEDREVAFQHYSNVAPPPPGSRVIAKPFRTRAVLRLRSGPDETTAANIVGRFEPGETVEVIGHTPDGRWAMVGESGVIVGYASTAWLASLDPARTLRRTVTAKARTAPARGAVQTTPTMASTQCKSLVATKGKKAQKETTKGCAAPDGRWLVA